MTRKAQLNILVASTYLQTATKYQWFWGETTLPCFYHFLHVRNGDNVSYKIPAFLKIQKHKHLHALLFCIRVGCLFHC
jgi:hypothetical protein